MSTLVTITGIDGAGKSTLAREVVHDLEQQGYSATYIYGRYLPRLAYPVMEIGRRTLFSNSDFYTDYSNHQESKREFFSRPTVRSLYEFLIMADYAPQLLYRLAPALATSEFIICDRYFYDTLLTDFIGTVIKSPQEAVSKYRDYSKFLPTPEYMFHLKIPIDIAYQRKDDTPAKEYLQDRKEFYDIFTSELDMYQLKGTDRVDQLAGQVVDTITGD